MKKFMKEFIALSILIIGLINGCVSDPKLNNSVNKNSFDPENNTVRNEFQFNGYTNYWQDTYREWIQYGNLMKMAKFNVEYTIAQSKVDLAEDIGIPGFSMQEGFLNSLLKESYISLNQPSVQQLENSLQNNNVQAFVDPDSEAGKILTKKYNGNNSLQEKLKSHQYSAEGFIKVDAFVLENGKRKLFVISSTDQKSLNKVKEILGKTEEVIKNYDMHRGWVGSQKLGNSVTSTPAYYLEVIGKGMNEGNDWFVFDGYMDFLAKNELAELTAKVKLPVVTDVGTQPIYGCKNYDGFKVNGDYTVAEWVKYAHDKGGYAFRVVYDTVAAHYPYDGFIASDLRPTLHDGDRVPGPTEPNAGNKEQLDNEDVPFISSTGNLLSDQITCMVLFSKKSEQFTNQLLWESVLSRREVAVLESGKMMGPGLYRNALEMLLLDRVFIEEYFGDKVSIGAVMIENQLNVKLTNTDSQGISGKLYLTLPSELKLTGESSFTIDLPANSAKTLVFNIQPGDDAMNKANPVAVHFNWGTSKKSTLATLNFGSKLVRITP